jgi:hypothetical protein
LEHSLERRKVPMNIIDCGDEHKIRDQRSEIRDQKSEVGSQNPASAS